MIDIRGLTFAYPHSRPVLTDISFHLGPGQTLSILGPNGCGKTTLLKAILGFLAVKAKTIFLNGAPLETHSRAALAKLMAYVPQANGSVFPYLSGDLVLMGRTGRRKWGGFDQADHRKAQEALELVGISHLAQRPYPELSGGQRQLVNIARALAQDSQFIFMDEPTSGLDLSNQALVLQTMEKIHQEKKVSFLMTTHRPEQSVYLGGEVLMLKRGQILGWGPARQLINSAAVEDLYSLEPGLLNKLGLIPACFGQA
ncbi:MAG: ABC transporter ATP-binding protein [Deltaproteobacteria bacterium]|nr:ABC transporter ATP-binding protein [Deltaproteobacteria bacterium]